MRDPAANARPRRAGLIISLIAYRAASELTDGLIHAVCFNDATVTCDLTDRVGSMDATLHGDAYCIAGEGIVLDGDADMIEFDPPYLGGDLTFSVYADVTSAAEHDKLLAVGDDYDHKICLHFPDSDGTLAFAVDEGTWYQASYAGGFGLSHWVGTVSGTTLKLYHDGELVSTRTDADAPAAGRFLAQTRNSHKC